jgi:hypothetical protein
MKENKIKLMGLTQESTDRILRYLKKADFFVLSFGSSFENPFEEISEEYFNEKINEALNG